jgi:Family of unknown function (DUF6310)
MDPSPGEWEDPSPRFANLQRAAHYPWTDDGHCVVREAANEWPILAGRCYHALDHDRVKFRDVTRRCAVASAGAAVAAVGLCVFAAPEIIIGAVIITGVVMVAVAIKEGLDAYERSASRERAKRKVQTRPSSEQEPVANREPTPRGLGRDWLPPVSSDTAERHPECRPHPVRHLGGNDLHDKCADRVPQNGFPGWDVLVNGKHFDALQLATRRLWEVKTTAIETYNPFVRRVELDKQVEEARRERELAAACGYDFVIGVRSEAHKRLLEERLRGFNIVLMTWC